MRSSVVIALALLAGCIGVPPEARPTEEDLAPAATGGPPTPPTAEPPPTAPEPSAEAAAPPAEPRTLVVNGSARVTAAAGAPCVMEVRPCSRGPLTRGELVVPEAGAASAALLVTWQSESPLDDEARVGVFAGEDGELVAAEGSSPIAIDVPAGALGGTPTFHVMVEPATGKVFVEREVALSLTLVYL